jgi:hypothetical protein
MNSGRNKAGTALALVHLYGAVDPCVRRLRRIRPLIPGIIEVIGTIQPAT